MFENIFKLFGHPEDNTNNNANNQVIMEVKNPDGTKYPEYLR